MIHENTGFCPKDNTDSSYADGEDISIDMPSDNDEAVNAVRIKARSIIQSRIAHWLQNSSFNNLCSYITGRVKGQPQAELVAITVYNYLQALSAGRNHSNNIIIAAPSGCGKTETFRAVRDYFEKTIPDLTVCQVDMTSITEEGFKGKDTNSILEGLKPMHNGIGIVFLDELDKKLIGSYTSYGSNVNLAIQSQLLTLIEGREVYNSNGKLIADTRNTLFIGMGAFNPCREKHAEASRHIGYGHDGTKESDHYDDITREDMVSLGGSYELIGRFSAVINYYALSHDVIDEIIDDTAERISRSLGCSVSVSGKMRKHLHEKANGRYGIRGIYNLMHAPAIKAYLELCKKDLDVSHYTIKITDASSARCHLSVNIDAANDMVTGETATYY